ncbi:MAG: hypothetical protein HZA23_06710 [Nitrospirae bacterium]|nr:hypothetical protein [Nitrospirota bacterium]
MAAPSSRILLDLNNPEFLDVFLRLDAAELRRVAQALFRIQKLDWNALYTHKGLRWEAVHHLQGPKGEVIYSIRLSEKIRALAYHEGPYLRFLSLHPDHDSAYRL